MRWSELPGKRFGPYELIEEIGRGGTSRVYRAFDHSQLRLVAFKVIPNDADDRNAFIQRFKRETDIVKQLRHEHIVPVFDAGETEEFVFQAMALVNGITLRQRAAERLSAVEAAQYMIQAALALQFAHELGIIHRDVKPSNMLLPFEAPTQLLLTDFGTAKILGARGPTKTGATIGTPEYMSPEQAEGKEVDQRSDIYSLGCTLYEALAGRPPFVGPTPVSVLYQQVHAQPTYIRSYNSDTPRELWGVLRICLAKRPSDRYGSAAQLVEELRPFAEGLIQPTPAPWRAPSTSRLPATGLDTPSNRPLRPTDSRPLDGPSASPLPPQFTPAPFPFTPHSSITLGPRIEPGPRQPRVTRRLDQDPGYIPPFAGQPNDGRWQAPPSVPVHPWPSVPPRVPGPNSGPLRPLGPEAAPYGPWSAPPSMPRGGSYGPASMPRGSSYGPASMPRAGTNGPVSMPRAGTNGPVSMPRADMADGRGWTGGPPPAYHSQTSGPLPGANSALYRAPVSGGYRGQPSGALSGAHNSYGPRVAVMSGPRQPIDSRATRSRPSLRTALVGVVAALMLVAALFMGAAGLGLFPGAVTARPTTKATATVTRPPTVTAPATSAPATATVNSQSPLDREAASAFRGITVAPTSDSSCSASRQVTNYASGQPVYINLCVADRSMPGPVTVVIRSNGAIVRTLMSQRYLAKGGTYSQGHTLGAGSYDMLITVTINGKTATAKDIHFTVS